MVQRVNVKKTIVLVKPYFMTICGTYLMLMQETNVNRGEGAATVWFFPVSRDKVFALRS